MLHKDYRTNRESILHFKIIWTGGLLLNAGGGIISQSSIEGSGRAEMEFDVFWEIYHNPIKTGHISKVT